MVFKDVFVVIFGLSDITLLLRTAFILKLELMLRLYSFNE